MCAVVLHMCLLGAGTQAGGRRHAQLEFRSAARFTPRPSHNPNPRLAPQTFEPSSLCTWRKSPLDPAVCLKLCESAPRYSSAFLAPAVLQSSLASAESRGGCTDLVKV